MNRSSRSLVGCGLVALGALAGCSDKSDKVVAGRTRSLSSVTSATAVASEASLELRRTREQVTGAETTVVAARLVNSGASEAALRFPDGTEERLEADASGALAITVRVPATTPASELSGAYSLLWFDALGSRRSVSLIATAGFPPYPTFTAPAEHALVDPEATHLEWSWEGTAGLFDVAVRDAPPASPELRYSASGLVEPSHDVQGLPAGRFERLEVAVGDVPSGRSVRWVSATTLDVDTLR
ncbi:MAG: hypothetical protein R3F62_13070 [Planctomycetota bacterium]